MSANAVEIAELNITKLDGLIENAITGMGDPEYDKTEHHRVGYAKRLDKMQLENLYEGSWLCGNCIDAYPIEGTRKWLEIKLGGKKSDKRLITEFGKYQDRLGVCKAFELASKWARLYGGAAIVVVTEDGGALDKPLRKNSINTIRKLKVLDRHKIRPYMVDADPLNPEFYELLLPPYQSRQFQQLIGQQTIVGAGLRVHSSRVIRFDGIEMPPDIMQRNQGWGSSVLDRIYDTFTRFEAGNVAVANLMDEASIFIYAIKGLSKLLAASDEKSEAILQRRLRAMRQTKGNLKALILDADGETATAITRSFAGIPDIMDKLQGHMCGASGIPMTILFGRGALGLAAQGTGDTEDQVWAKLVSQFQSSSFSPKLRSPEELGLFDLIWLAKDGPTKGRIPDDWSFDFVNLDEPTEEEILSVKEKQSNIDRTYTDMGVLLKDEIRESRFRGADYSTETVLDDKLWAEKKAQEEAGFSDFGDDYGLGGDGSGDGSDPSQSPDNGAIAPDQNGQNGQNGNGKVPVGAGANGNGRTDSAEPVKYVLKWNGLRLGVSHEPGDTRHGRPMEAHYTKVYGSYGDAEDGMAIDAYLGENPDSTKAFKVKQLRQNGDFDETKWIFGCDSKEQATNLYLKHMPRKLFGGIEEGSLDELQKYRKDCGGDCACNACSATPDDAQPKKRRKKKRQNPTTPDGGSILNPTLTDKIAGAIA